MTIRSSGRSRVREHAGPGDHLDVELQAVQVVERHPLEQRPAALHQILLRGIGNAIDAGVRVRPQVPHGVMVGGPGVEDDEVAVGVGAAQRPATEALSGKSRQGLEIGQKQEGVIGNVFDRRHAVPVLAPVHPHARLLACETAAQRV